MNAIHVNRTRPFFLHGGKQYEIEDFEILTTILSALKWREKNGSICMITDAYGKEYYIRQGMETVWDGGIHSLLDNMPDTIDERVFWAAGKLYALSGQNAPVVMIDTDFIVWEEINFQALKNPLWVIHFEDLYPDVYPDPAVFRMKPEYHFPENMSKEILPCNTAFCMIQSEDFLRFYTSQAIHFIELADRPEDTLTYMVFAEQRMFSICAEIMGLKVQAFSNLERLFEHAENYFTHTWGMKQQMREDSRLRTDFCLRCIDRILRDFPDYEQMLRGITCLRRYFAE